MESKISGAASLASCLLLLFLAAVAAGRGAEAWSSGGTMTASAAAAWRTLEDAVEPEPLPAQLDRVRRLVILSSSGGHIAPGALDPNKPACPKTPCAGPGGPYVGRGCYNIYGCQH